MDGDGGLGGAGTGGSVGGQGPTGGDAGNGGTATDAAGGIGGNAGASTGGADNTGEPGVRIVGRTAPGGTGTRFEWPGVSIEARFFGSQVSIELEDGGNGNQFEVIVDGVAHDTLVTSPGQTTYQLASGLEDGVHELMVWRRTEAYDGTTEFMGLSDFGPTGELLAPSAPPDRRIEVIGDSISVGFGIQGAPECDDEKSDKNNYLAYGSVAARELGADLHTIAWSGIGMYRNYNQPVGPADEVMPARYDDALPNSSTSWDFTQFHPHVVVINLSSNDYSTQGDPGQPYVDAYVDFVQRLRGNYPDAYILCLIQWSTSGPNTEQVVQIVRSGGDDRISSLDINVSAGGDGCSGHPNVERSAAMGSKLAEEIRSIMGW